MSPISQDLLGRVYEYFLGKFGSSEGEFYTPPTIVKLLVGMIEPYEFDESILGRIPKGWRIGTIGALICDILGGDWGKKHHMGILLKKLFA